VLTFCKLLNRTSSMSVHDTLTLRTAPCDNLHVRNRLQHSPVTFVQQAEWKVSSEHNNIHTQVTKKGKTQDAI